MKYKLYNFGARFKVVTSAWEVAYLDHKPKNGQVLTFTGSNGPVNRMVLNMEDLTVNQAIRQSQHELCEAYSAHLTRELNQSRNGGAQ